MSTIFEQGFHEGLEKSAAKVPSFAMTAEQLAAKNIPAFRKGKRAKKKAATGSGGAAGGAGFGVGRATA